MSGDPPAASTSARLSSGGPMTNRLDGRPPRGPGPRYSHRPNPVWTSASRALPAAPGPR
jgi:hypothetical protein